MIKVEKLAEVVEENEQYVGGVRYIAEYMAKNNYCCDIDKAKSDCGCEKYLIKDGCIKCWMIHLTDEIKEEKEKKK